MRRHRPFLLVSATAIATLFVVLLALNLGGGEKTLETRVESTCGTHDPQFRRTMSSLLSAPVLDGDRVSDLQHGAEIFPPMLEAIRSARKSITFEAWSQRPWREKAWEHLASWLGPQL
ncbi:hypothetical protein [Piscinibacter gummiphilus]|uniref:Uncharacterized protein n=1 Tax=Piscinibacter gummiphilus TaxID=946333 RepID=A0A1W6L9V0_9BURK|nr:hypothetical protein [Piscinibacter gummiphilus]ARN21000.1 hypothetical protein A4W93_14465 [Piscinibacter gummiphilus]ATU65675.1 hypothetical protein CPZ87_14550 [Piscinibacter gummiphilus]GLS93534.1 hypothetical protein GCM10007918_08250 [Piscinibacter gummiphilus]